MVEDEQVPAVDEPAVAGELAGSELATEGAADFGGDQFDVEAELDAVAEHSLTGPTAEPTDE